MVNCCVEGCNHNRKNSSVTLHQFPRKEKEPERYQAWKNRINRKHFFPNSNNVVCSLHFTDEDFENKLMKTLLPDKNLKRMLKKTAVPSLLLDKKQTKITVPTSVRKSSRKKIEVQSQIELVKQAFPLDAMPDEPMDMDNLDIKEDITEMTIEEVGIQCELGKKEFHKYSIENNSQKKSIHSAFSEKESISETTVKKEVDDDEEITEDSEFEYVLVQTKLLMPLFSFCSICKSPVKDIKKFTKGAVLHVKYKCPNGHCQTWSSSENPDK
ncbi:unnamed protein product [Ceutorhynchus assimilis]|uniref:THAP-type domain-containing protein n=1 Tax=Ceutorhynchus assimilis TaxID=467358 RepID=A0A9N9QF94_9CUCU|nr:unnamed protein product [Ceutorhynchus assimilis]